MIPLDKIEELRHKAGGQGIPQGILRPLETVLDDIPALALSEAEAERLRRGLPVKLADPEVSVQARHGSGAVGCTCPLHWPAAMADLIRPRRVFNLQGRGKQRSG